MDWCISGFRCREKIRWVLTGTGDHVGLLSLSPSAGDALSSAAGAQLSSSGKLKERIYNYDTSACSVKLSYYDTSACSVKLSNCDNSDRRECNY